MCPAASPAGADRLPAPSQGEAATQPSSPALSRPAAAGIVGISLLELRRWERLLSVAGFKLGVEIGTADLVSLAVMRVAVRRLGGRADPFALGFGQLFQALRRRADVERLHDHAALVGRDFARIVELGAGRVCCAGDDFLVIPLREILGDLRDRAFA